jgi:DNA mismatch repair protein MutL
MHNDRVSRRIQILREEVTRKIAAGEVIDRPFSVVRELLDNSLDAECSEIILMIEGGGLSRIRVIDDGFGLSEENLRLCFLSHSTSKIREEEDLYRSTTLGFRGEALASIGACARLEIVSKPREEDHANRLTVEDGKLLSLDPCQGKDGTHAEVSELFVHMPVRRKFLKSRSAETAMCKSIFIDKTLPFPDLSFRFFVDGNLKIFLPAQDLLSRVSAAYSTQLKPSLLHEIEVDGEGYTARVILGGPELSRRDRKLIQIFINKRRIFTYPLVQAMEYAFSPYLPGGNFPMAFIFLEIIPQLVDFNVHPAKKEARIKILPQIHRDLALKTKSFLSSFNLSIQTEAPPAVTQKSFSPFTENSTGKPGRFYSKSAEEWIIPALTNQKPEYVETEKENIPFRFLGQIFNLFLLVETAESFYLVDQHAAHEKILYNRLKSTGKKAQEILFPISFEVSEEEESELVKREKDLGKFGIYLEKVGKHSFEIVSLCPELSAIEEGELVEVIKKTDISLDQLEDEIYRLAACRAAIKEGDPVDPATAGELIRETFELENARCPHGRPIWHKITREELFRLVGRT